MTSSATCPGSNLLTTIRAGRKRPGNSRARKLATYGSKHPEASAQALMIKHLQTTPIERQPVGALWARFGALWRRARAPASPAASAGLVGPSFTFFAAIPLVIHAANSIIPPMQLEALK